MQRMCSITISLKYSLKVHIKQSSGKGQAILTNQETLYMTIRLQYHSIKLASLR